MKLLAIMNPTAGNGRAARLRSRLEEAFRSRGLHGTFTWTEHPGHGERIAAEAAASGDWDGLIAIGGDGTVHEAMNGIGEADLAVGIIPIGTGNDFARALAIPRDVDRAVDVIAAGHTRAVDLGEVNGRRYVQVAGVGFDAQVADMVSRNRARLPGGGALPYLWGILQQMAHYKNQPLSIRVDDMEIQQEALMIAIGNTRNYAGGLMICPEASLNDGLLDVCLIGNLNRLQRLGVLANVFSGRHVRHPGVSYWKASRLRIEGPSKLLIQADGQILGRLPADIRVLPLAAEVFAPPEQGSALDSTPGAQYNRDRR